MFACINHLTKSHRRPQIGAPCQTRGRSVETLTRYRCRGLGWRGRSCARHQVLYTAAKRLLPLKLPHVCPEPVLRKITCDITVVSLHSASYQQQIARKGAVFFPHAPAATLTIVAWHTGPSNAGSGPTWLNVVPPSVLRALPLQSQLTFGGSCLQVFERA